MANVLEYWREKTVNNTENRTLECTRIRILMMETVPRPPQKNVGSCAICGYQGLYVFFVHEMQIGLLEVFKYGLCNQCGAITRLSKIDNMARYYPEKYYAFVPGAKQPPGRSSKSWLRNRRDRALLIKGIDPIGRILGRTSPETTSLYRILGKSQLNPSSNILDIGCGSGHLLQRMAELGFQNLLGIDLFVPETTSRNSKNIKIVRGNLSQLQGSTFDLIMMHHCLEHNEDQVNELQLARELLSQNGSILVRQPLSDSEAFRKYGTNWFQLDAPRHAVIHSVKSMGLLAAKCRLRIREIIWDSTDEQFWASEQYARGISMYDECSYLRNPAHSLFSISQIVEWKKKANILNKNGVGDQAAFYIKRGP